MRTSNEGKEVIIMAKKKILAKKLPLLMVKKLQRGLMCALLIKLIYVESQMANKIVLFQASCWQSNKLKFFDILPSICILRYDVDFARLNSDWAGFVFDEKTSLLPSRLIIFFQLLGIFDYFGSTRESWRKGDIVVRIFIEKVYLFIIIFE